MLSIPREVGLFSTVMKISVLFPRRRLVIDQMNKVLGET